MKKQFQPWLNPVVELKFHFVGRGFFFAPPSEILFSFRAPSASAASSEDLRLAVARGAEYDAELDALREPGGLHCAGPCAWDRSLRVQGPGALGPFLFWGGVGFPC